MSQLRVWTEVDDPPGIKRGVCVCGVPISIETSWDSRLHLTLNHGEIALVSTSPALGMSFDFFSADRTAYEMREAKLLRDALATAHFASNQ